MAATKLAVKRGRSRTVSKTFQETEPHVCRQVAHDQVTIAYCFDWVTCPFEETETTTDRGPPAELPA